MGRGFYVVIDEPQPQAKSYSPQEAGLTMNNLGREAKSSLQESQQTSDTQGRHMVVNLSYIYIMKQAITRHRGNRRVPDTHNCKFTRARANPVAEAGSWPVGLLPLPKLPRTQAV